MLTIEEIICGTEEEIIEHINTKYNPSVSRRLDTVEEYYTLGDFDTLKDQLSRESIKLSHFGAIYLLKIGKLTETAEGEPECSINIEKFWVFVRAPRTNDADAS